MDPLDEEPSPGGSDADEGASPSNYSSCDGSDFERYCSANSALGSASLCSSVGNRSDLLDSLRSSLRWNGVDGLVDGVGGETPRENGQGAISLDAISPSSRIRAGARLFRSSAEVSPTSRGKSATVSGSVEHRVDFDGDVRCEDLDFDGRGNGHLRDGNLMDRMSLLARSELLLKSVESSLAKGESAANALIPAVGSGSMEEQIGFDDNLSCEHSEGEDSSIGYDSGNEGRIQFLKRSNLQFSNQTRDETGNPLFMNSAVAFGSDDWDEFELQRGEDGLGSVSLYKGDQHLQQQPVIYHVEAPDVLGKEVDGKTRLTENVVSSMQKPPSEETPGKDTATFYYAGKERKDQSALSREVSGLDAGEASTKQMPDEPELMVTPRRNGIFEQSFNALNSAFERNVSEPKELDGVNSLLPLVGIGQGLAPESIVSKSESTNVVGEDLLQDEAKKLDNIDSYDEMVHEMEEILLDSGNSRGARSVHGSYTTQHSHHLRDGSSTASTSGLDDVYPLSQYPPNIDRVEVVGAKQKKGDVSFGERLVGVKEYTIYKLRVWSGPDQWEVERRYRDFFCLYRQLYTLFTECGLSLPSPWSKVEQESRKIFGNASPDVISKRSMLIQDCIQSILNSNLPIGTPNPLVSFLSPGQTIPSTSLLQSLVPKSFHKFGNDQNSKSFSSSSDSSVLGKTISLVVEIKPHKSARQLLEAQHYTCAGCHRQLDAGKTLLREIVQTIGWNKPRFCEYTSQLFCSSCHTYDTNVLPAKVLQRWDFSLYPVSQLAKAYLDSIYDQPMLCVSAVNPFLFSKVPALLHVMSVRKKIGAMLPYVSCPFRKAVQRTLGHRRYLLESNDFFALRDLVDLSKGAFAALPVMMENVSNKILVHITEQCLVCYDSGIPCSARQDCDDPASLIFPFQEAEAEKCPSCKTLFHKPCFVKLMGCCPCGKLKGSGRKPASPPTLETVSEQSVQPSGSNLASGLISDILSKARPDKMWRPKNSSPVILMGSLPSTSF